MTEEKVAKTNEDLNKAFRPDREVIQVGGEAVYIAELSGEEALSLATGEGYIYRLLAHAIVDKDGKRRFGDADSDVAEIKRWGSRKLRKLIAAALRLNGLDDEPEKNSGAGPSAG
jgi:hypothetical protein